MNEDDIELETFFQQFNNKPPYRKPGHVYVLRLEGGYYYVGWSNHVWHRLMQHCLGVGSVVTKQFPPVKIVLLMEGTTETESKVTRAMREKLGDHRVRGAGWTTPFPI